MRESAVQVFNLTSIIVIIITTTSSTSLPLLTTSFTCAQRQPAPPCSHLAFLCYLLYIFSLLFDLPFSYSTNCPSFLLHRYPQVCLHRYISSRSSSDSAASHLTIHLLTVSLTHQIHCDSIRAYPIALLTRASPPDTQYRHTTSRAQLDESRQDSRRYCMSSTRILAIS